MFRYNEEAPIFLISLHFALAAATLLFSVATEGTVDGWAKLIQVLGLAVAVVGSYVLCIPMYIFYFNRNLNDRGAWFCIFIQISLNLLILAFVHMSFGIKFDGSVTNTFGEAIYFSIVTFTTLGYGDYQPILVGRYFAAVQALAGYLVLGLTVGAIIFWAQTRSK